MAKDCHRRHINHRRGLDDTSQLLLRLRCALEKVASLVVVDTIYLPIFERIEQEIRNLEAQEDAVERARKVVAQSANG